MWRRGRAVEEDTVAWGLASFWFLLLKWCGEWGANGHNGTLSRALGDPERDGLCHLCHRHTTGSKLLSILEMVHVTAYSLSS